MQHLTVYETPKVKTKHLIVALSGWSDGAEAATAALRYLVRHFGAKLCAELDPEEFYDFSHVRPYTSFSKDNQRRLRWPTNKLFYSIGDDSAQGLLFFLGVEPSLKWRTYSDTIIEVSQQWGVKTIINIGALLDSVPHTRDTLLTGWSNKEDCIPKLNELELRNSRYQGPAGITSVLMEACTLRNLCFATVWGHVPHYLQAAPNYKASHAILKALSSLLDLKLDLAELESTAGKYQELVASTIAIDSQLSEYVRKLETHYDDAQGTSLEMPLPEEAVRELEKFLKERQRQGGLGGAT